MAKLSKCLLVGQTNRLELKKTLNLGFGSSIFQNNIFHLVREVFHKHLTNVGKLGLASYLEDHLDIFQTVSVNISSS